MRNDQPTSDFPVSLAGLAKWWRCIYIKRSSFGRMKLALPAKARLSDDLLQNPRLNRQRSRAALLLILKAENANDSRNREVVQ
jgi:hypothetical protein